MKQADHYTAIHFVKEVFLCFLFLFISIPLFVFSQITLSIKSDTNKLCDGNGCNYTGPKILINEVMISPVAGDGSMAGIGPPPFTPTSNRGEWIELYNANKCDSVDISCFFLGNVAYDNGVNYGGGYEIPPGTVVPPMCFVLLRGEAAPEVPDSLLLENGGNTIEIIVKLDQHVCVDGGYRLWFPNYGGWFAFYNSAGETQDAIYWKSLAYTDVNKHPCTPNSSCPLMALLPSFSQIPVSKRTYIFSSDPPEGKTFGRVPDGGQWAAGHPADPTMGFCNGICNPQPLMSCTGKLSVVVTGGIPPYTYQWNDPIHQTNDTAFNLCLGYYCVTVTDMAGNTAVICDSVHNYIPIVTLDSLEDMCSNDLPIFLTTGSPYGGTYCGPGVYEGVFYPDSVAPGLITITYNYCDEDSCISSAYCSFRVFGAPQAHLNSVPALCDNSQPVTLISQIPEGGMLTGHGLIGNVFYPPLAGVGMHEIILEITDHEGCMDIDTLDIVVNTSPYAHVQNPDTFCITQDPVIFDFGYPKGGTYYIDQIPVTKFFPEKFGVGSFQGMYVYKLNTNSCTDTAYFNIFIRPVPTLTVQAVPPLICQGQPCLVIAHGAKYFEWYSSFGSNDSILVYPNFPTVYTVIGSDAPGCSTLENVRVEVAPSPWFDLGPSRWELFGNTIELKGPDGADRYLWSTGSTNRSITVDEEDIYWLQVETDHSYPAGDITCVISDTVFVGITGCVFVPDAFTPNGDGKNEVFLAKCGFELKSFEMIILNRWGNVLFTSDDINIGWDGRYRDELCPDGAYECIVRYKTLGGPVCDKNQVVKSILLLR